MLSLWVSPGKQWRYRFAKVGIGRCEAPVTELSVESLELGEGCRCIVDWGKKGILGCINPNQRRFGEGTRSAAIPVA